MYLNPPSSYFNKASRNRVLSSSPDPAIHSIAFAKPHRLLLAIPQSFPSFKTLSTLWIGVGCVWVQISSQGMTMREGWRKGYNDFSLRMSNFLSKRWVCVVENLFRVFFSEWPLLHLWVTRVYIAWVKGKQVTHKKKKNSKQKVSRLSRRKALLARHSRKRQPGTTLQLPVMCFSHAFSREPSSRTSHELLAKCTDLQLSLSLHQLNNKIPQNTRNKIKVITKLFVME